MRGSLVPAHRRASTGAAAAPVPADQVSHSSFLPSHGSGVRNCFSSPWDPSQTAGAHKRPASAGGARRTIVDNGISLTGQSKAAAEIQHAVRAAGPVLGFRGGGADKAGTAAAGGARVEDYVQVKKLGEGASGSVHLAELKGDGTRWVLKQVQVCAEIPFDLVKLLVSLTDNGAVRLPTLEE